MATTAMAPAPDEQSAAAISNSTITTTTSDGGLDERAVESPETVNAVLSAKMAMTGIAPVPNGHSAAATNTSDGGLNEPEKSPEEDRFDTTLSAALQYARAAYKARNPASEAAAQTCAQYMPGGNTRSSLHAAPFALTLASGHGSVLIDADGHAYHDFLGEYSAGIFGHDDARIRAAVERALDNGWNFGGYSRHEQELARKVCERFGPAGMEMVRFTNSGTEANMCALAAAMAFAGPAPCKEEGVNVNRKVLVFEGGYHGSTMGFPVGSRHDNEMNSPYQWVVAPYNNIEGTSKVVDRFCPMKHDGDRLVAILVEPMQGNAGARPADPQFLLYLRHLADKHHATLIFDEVQTSRLGIHGLGYAMGNSMGPVHVVQPDLITLGKWVGGGMSFGAFGGRRSLMEQFDPSYGSESNAGRGRGGLGTGKHIRGPLRHAGTFNNNVLSMAAGCAGLDILTEEVLTSLNARGERLKALLQEVLARWGWGEHDGEHKLKHEHEHKHGYGHLLHPEENYRNQQTVKETTQHKLVPPCMHVSGTGSILAVTFRGGSSTKQRDALQALFYHHMLEHGIYLGTKGFMALSICITDDQIMAFVAAVEVFLERYKVLFVGVDGRGKVRDGRAIKQKDGEMNGYGEWDEIKQEEVVDAI